MRNEDEAGENTQSKEKEENGSLPTPKKQMDILLGDLVVASLEGEKEREKVEEKYYKRKPDEGTHKIDGPPPFRLVHNQSQKDEGQVQEIEVNAAHGCFLSNFDVKGKGFPSS